MSDAFRISRGDVDAMLGIFVDNLSVFLVAISLCLFVIEVPADIVFGRILPGMVVGILISNIHLRWLAARLARETGRDDITALPSGVSIVFVIIYTLGIMLPVKIATGDAELAWQVTVVAAMLGGVLEMVGAVIGPQLQKFLPRAAMLGTLAGIGVVFIAGLNLGDIFGNPLIGFPALAIILWAYVGRGKLPFGVPAGLLALIVGAVIALGLGQAQINFADAGLTMPYPWGLTLSAEAWNQALTRFLSVIIPIAVINIVVTIDNVDSAQAVGDPYPVREPMFMDGVVSLIGGVFGSPYPNTVFIGHPAYKEMGAKTNYGLMAAALLFVLALFGMYQGISTLIPLAAVLAILIFVGLTMTEVGFREVPEAHYVAVGAAVLPFIIELGKEHIDMTTSELGVAALQGTDLQAAFPGYMELSYGTVIIAMVLSSLIAFMVDREFNKAAITAVVASVLAFFGVIHTPEMSIGAAPQLSLMWLLIGVGFVVVNRFEDVVLEDKAGLEELAPATDVSPVAEPAYAADGGEEHQ